MGCGSGSLSSESVTPMAPLAFRPFPPVRRSHQMKKAVQDDPVPTFAPRQYRAKFLFVGSLRLPYFSRWRYFYLGLCEALIHVGLTIEISLSILMRFRNILQSYIVKASLLSTAFIKADRTLKNSTELAFCFLFLFASYVEIRLMIHVNSNLWILTIYLLSSLRTTAS